MNKYMRQKMILDTAKSSGRVSISDLSQFSGASEITIRRDLRELIEQGHLQPMPGGAAYIDKSINRYDILRRQNEFNDVKESIGKAAAGLISDGMCVFLGSGSTTIHVAHYLNGIKNLTVVTNALNVAMELVFVEGVTIIVAGGILRPSEFALHGHMVSQSLQDVRVDKVIMGIRGLSLEVGLTNDHIEDVPTFRSFIDLSKDLILVADHTKIGKVSSAFVAPVERISTLVTDAETDPGFLSCLKERGVKVIVAE